MSKRTNVSEAPPPGPDAVLPRPWVRWLVSLLIAWHFFAILTACLSAGTSQFPFSVLAMRANLYLTRGYLQILFLTNPYRFYAPNPGPSNVLWLRLTYDDGVVRWVELPRRQNYSYAGRMPYQRQLAMVMLFDQLALPVQNSADPTLRQLTDEGRIVIASLVRHVALEHPRTAADGAVIPVDRIEFYNVSHMVIEPWQVQKGWKADDLRLYVPFYLGTYESDGTQRDPGTRYVEFRVVWKLAADILSRDAYPLFRTYPDRDRMELLEELNTPMAIRALLQRFPELANPDLSSGDLKRRIEEFVVSEPRPVEPVRPTGSGAQAPTR